MERKKSLWIGFFLLVWLGGFCGVVRGQSLQDYNNEGMQRANRSDFHRAFQAWEQGLELARKRDDRGWLSVFLGNLGVVYSELGDYSQALAHHDQALQIKRAIGDRQGEGAALINLGNVYSELGDYPRALAHYEQALQIDRAIGARQGEGDNLTGTGVVYSELGDYPRALVISFAVCGVAAGLVFPSPTATSFPVRSGAVSFP
jgi:tetratricopeptide (TPR) repeat protein